MRMNQEEKTHWTQDKILLYVKACMSATGLTRMPSRSELSEYYGNDKLTNAIRRFPGGYYKIAEILNVEMKESETQFGKYGEDLATKLLEEAERLGCKTAAEYNQLCPIGGSRAKGNRVDRAQPSGNGVLSPELMAHSRERLRKQRKGD
jgi:hypothetical protein